MTKMKERDSDKNGLSSSGLELETDFVERMKACAERVGSVSALAKAAGISQSGIRRYFSGGEPTRPQLIALAKAAGVDVGWLVLGEASPMPVEGKPARERPVENGVEIEKLSPEASIEDYAFVPLYDAQCSAGGGSWNEGCRVLTHISFTRYSLRKQGLTPDHLSAIRVDGESMEPILHSGDTVLIDHTRTSVEGEGIYVLRLDGHLYAKKLQRQFDGIAIISANKEYEKILVPRNRLNELEIVGRAVWSAGWL